MSNPDMRRVTIDFNDVVSEIREMLDCNSILNEHIDFKPIVEHFCDIVTLGSTFESYTGNSFYEVLEELGVPTDVKKALSQELKNKISNKLAAFSDFFSENVHYTFAWHKNDFVTDVDIITYS